MFVCINLAGHIFRSDLWTDAIQSGRDGGGSAEQGRDSLSSDRSGLRPPTSQRVAPNVPPSVGLLQAGPVGHQVTRFRRRQPVPIRIRGSGLLV